MIISRRVNFNVMIKSFKHKGLKKYFETGVSKGLPSSHLRKIAGILDLLDCSEEVDSFMPFYQCHELKGSRKGICSMIVSGNWRITFEFKEGNAYILNYEDYH